eukprot:comp23417_c0_seq1/m.38928 comp23417_c0_seq1/g.38928  ORF comp23417_c0_seq1/g.38928 comp23417_c0_seq1/m.38928 type:complete len:371 (-) comp23417_c0_seq1:483-1595(-)
MGKGKESSGLSSREYEMEEQFILRLPEEQAQKLRELLRRHALKDLLKFKWQEDMRHCTVQFGDSVLQGRLVDLPCIIESQKTLDNMNFYKSADVSQMLVCTEGAEEITQAKKDTKSKTEYAWPHGLTAPLRNVRKRRFRKTAQKKFMASQDVENEVKNLIDEDAHAINVTYEIIDVIEADKNEEEDQDMEDMDDIDDEDAGEAAETRSIRPEDDDDVRSHMTSEADGADDDDLGLDSDTEEEVEKDEDEEDEDAGGKGKSAHESGEDTQQQDNSEDDDEEDDDDMEDAQGAQEGGKTDSQRVRELEDQVGSLEAEIDDLNKKIAGKERDAAAMPNPMLKRKFTKEVEDLQAELRKKTADLQAAKDELSSM